MNWEFEFTRQAESDLRALPKPVQRLISLAIGRMAEDPFAGDAKPLHGPVWQGIWRRRAGHYRLLFLPHTSQHRVTIVAILRRTEGTYR